MILKSRNNRGVLNTLILLGVYDIVISLLGVRMFSCCRHISLKAVKPRVTLIDVLRVFTLLNIICSR